MSLIPKTLSTDLRRGIDPKMAETELLDKLKKDPPLLFKFFLQAMQNLAWLTKHKSFAANLLETVNHLLLHQILPCTVIRKIDAFKNDLLNCIVVSKPDIFFGTTFFSRLVMFIECENFRKKWLDDPDKVILASDIAYYITLEQAHELFKSMVTKEFGIFQKESLEILQKYLLEAKRWGYSKGIIELQKLIVNYVDEISSIFGLYYYADENNFELLKEHCKSVIDNYEFIESTDDSGRKCLLHYELFSDPNSFSGIGALNRTMRRERFDSFWAYRENCQGVVVRQISFTFLKEEVIEVGQSYLSSQEAESKKAVTASLPRAKLDPGQVIQIVSDGKNKIADVFISGMIRYFCLCRNVVLNSYLEVTFEQLQTLSYAQSDLLVLTLDSGNVKEEVIRKIPDLFKNLAALSLTSVRISKELLSVLMNSQINHLSLPNTELDLPDDLKDLSRLVFLSLSHIKTLTEEELKRLFAQLNHLKKLHAVHTLNFKLEWIAYPHSLQEIAVSADTLCHYMEKDEVLMRFPVLKQVEVIGPLTPNVKGFFINCMRKRADVSFKFHSTLK